MHLVFLGTDSANCMQQGGGSRARTRVAEDLAKSYGAWLVERVSVTAITRVVIDNLLNNTSVTGKGQSGNHLREFSVYPSGRRLSW